MGTQPSKIGDLLDALAVIHYLPESVSQPSWIEGDNNKGTFVSCANGLLDVSSREVLAHTPAFFSVTSVPFPYEPGAGKPGHWLAFPGGVVAG